MLDWYRDNKLVREKGYTATLIGKDAARLIEKHDPASPLYLYLTFNAAHTPYQALKEHIDRYKHIEDPRAGPMPEWSPASRTKSVASTAECKPIDGLNVWKTISEGASSPRTEIIYNIEPFRGALRQGDWKLIWRIMLPSSVDLYALAQDPSERNNLAAANPDKVAAFKQRLDTLAHDAAKPLFLVDQFKVVQKNMAGEPMMPIEEGFGEIDGH